MPKAQPNQYGVTWAPSRSGKIQIAVGPDRDWLGQLQVDVWALYTGTHDMVEVARCFVGDGRTADARAYANRLWNSR